jgi:23S rRNA (pseudouridine1915-N3)-methyltransferase
MKFYILTVANKVPAWIETGFFEYAKRLPHEMTINLVSIKPEKRSSGKNTEQILSLECVRIRAALPAGCRVIALDEKGGQWTTIKLADSLTKWMSEGGDVAFIIGGADGLHRDIKQLAHEKLALSAMTLPHGFVRVLLAEQLYRAISICKRHPYHRG